MPFKNKEDYAEYMRRYRAKQRANWRTDLNEPEPYAELEGYADFMQQPRRILDNFGEDKKGMVVICSVCGTQLDKNGSCPICAKSCFCD